jgi:hypothetical protein
MAEKDYVTYREDGALATGYIAKPRTLLPRAFAPLALLGLGLSFRRGIVRRVGRVRLVVIRPLD